MNVQAKPVASVGAGAGFRMLHTMIRVFDLEKSIDFYTRLLGMKLLRRKDYPSGEFTLAFVGYGDEESEAVIELTHNWGQKTPYEIGSGFGHLAIGVPDIYGTCDASEQGRRQDPAPARPDEAWRQRHRLRRGSRRLQDRADQPDVMQKGPARAPFSMSACSRRYLRWSTGT